MSALLPARPAIEATLMILPLLARDHAVLADRLAHQEDRAHVEVHHLVPGLERMILGRRAPGRAGVVDEDVDVAEARDRVLRRRARSRSAGSRRRRSRSRRCPASSAAPPTPRGPRPCARSASRFAPASPSASAICRPRPREPPVTSAVLPARSNSWRTEVLMAGLRFRMERAGGVALARRAGASATQTRTTPTTTAMRRRRS